MEGVVAAALWVAVLSILADQLIGLLGRALSPRGVRHLTAQADAVPV